jgi:hypothetical protein
MADKRISELTTIVTVDNTADFFPIVDTSETETKKITPNALKTSLALNNVNNTSDANKPISDATQTALNAKQNSLGYTAENVANKSITLDADKLSDTKFPSVKSVYDWAVGLFVAKNSTITGATKTKITYDAKGLVTSGADATTADIADSTNKRYVSDAQLTVIGNTSGTNTGDNATNSQYSGLAASKQDVLVSGTSIKTLEGQSLLGSGNIDLAKSDVGLGNVDNTSDANKPVSTATQTALDLKTNKLIVANRQTASYTLISSDADKIVEMNVASANNLTVPASVFAAGNQILLAQYGAGQTTVVAGSGMTIRSNGGKLKLSAQYSGASLVFVSATECYLFGDITA